MSMFASYAPDPDMTGDDYAPATEPSRGPIPAAGHAHLLSTTQFASGSSSSSGASPVSSEFDHGAATGRGAPGAGQP